MPYPDNFSSARHDAAMGSEPSPRADANGAAADAACRILQRAIDALRAIPTPPGIRTAEMIDEAVAWMDEQGGAIRCTADLEAQDL